MLNKEMVLEQIKKVIDPEIGIDIVSLGLIYGVSIDEEKKVTVTMTLTIPGCPLVSYLTNEVKRVVEELEDVKEAEVELVFDPPWSQDMISDDVKKKFGMENI